MARALAAGEGTGKDVAAAARHFRLAWDKGMPDSGTALATLLWDGDGVEQNRSEALSLYRLAADRGSPGAHEFLADQYESGEAVSKDASRGLLHFALAARLYGDRGEDFDAKHSLARRGTLARTLPIDAVKAIWSELEAWKPTGINR